MAENKHLPILTLIFMAANILSHSDALSHLILKNSLGPRRVVAVRCYEASKNKFWPVKQIFPNEEYDIPFTPDYARFSPPFNCSILHDTQFFAFEFLTGEHRIRCDSDRCCFEIKRNTICHCGRNLCYEPGWEFGN